MLDLGPVLILDTGGAAAGPDLKAVPAAGDAALLDAYSQAVIHIVDGIGRRWCGFSRRRTAARRARLRA